MEFSLRPLGFMEFLQNNNDQAVNKMKWIYIHTSSNHPSSITKQIPKIYQS